jgi:hypothetical protein
VVAEHRFPRTKRWRFVAFIVVILMALAACGGGAEAPSEGLPPEGGVASAFQATLTCSQECANRGFCGTSPDRGQVVLLNREGPSVTPSEFDLAIPDNTRVDILDQRVETVVELTSSIPFDTTFFNVFVPDRQDGGWAAAWCVVQSVP